jgi:signal transduction histidine kinase
MFKKIHKKLTLLFTGISWLILIISSANNLYIAEQSLKENSFYSFQSDMNTLLTNLENQPVITYEWLLKMEGNGKYKIGIYDNQVPLSFLHITKNRQEQDLLQEAKEYYEAYSPESIAAHTLNSTHTEFKYTSEEKKEYYGSAAIIKAANGELEAIILYSLGVLEAQLLRQRLLFLMINLLSVSLIAVFSWHYTKHLLKPLEAGQKKQLQFVAASSHELRTPLSVMLSSLSALRKAEASQKEGFLHIIEHEGYRMSRLIEDMLMLTNADNHSWTFQKNNVELDTLVLECYEAFCPLAKENRISLYVQLPEEALPHCYCDKQRMEQLISILLQNAISYGKKEGSIVLSLRKEKHHFIISVADDGIGFAAKDKPHVFDRFYRADSSRSSKEHFGLGLSIAKEIVDAHKGTIRIEDTEGGGATLVVVLPAAQKI